MNNYERRNGEFTQSPLNHVGTAVYSRFTALEHMFESREVQEHPADDTTGTETDPLHLAAEEVAWWTSELVAEEAISPMSDPAPDATAFAKCFHTRLRHHDEDSSLSTDLTLISAVSFTLRHVASLLQGTPTRDRGALIADVITGLPDPTGLHPFRFRLGSMLSHYASLTPSTDATFINDVENLNPIPAWSHPHLGVVFDQIDTVAYGPDSEYLTTEITALIDLGIECFGDDFAGVRHLPLEEIRAARWYDRDGGWQSLWAAPETTTGGAA